MKQTSILPWCKLHAIYADPCPWCDCDRLTAELAAALESQHRWRSVAEEKPPKDCLCLVAVPRHEHPLVDYWNGFIWLDWQPTHWMPLPALPPADPEPTT